MNKIRPVSALYLAVMLALGLLFLSSPATAAQETTPVASPGGQATPMAEGVRLTAALHEGTCEEIGAVAFDLGELDLAGETEDGEVRGAAPESPLLAVDADIEGLGFNALLDEATHALVIHNATDEPVACGDVGGTVDGDTLTIALRPVDNGNYAGIAQLEEDEATLGLGEDELEVELYLFQL